MDGTGVNPQVGPAECRCSRVPRLRRKPSGSRERACGRFWLEQGGGFEQAAKLFFAAPVMGAVAGLEVLHHFVSNFQAFQMNDADEFIAPFPDLALLKL